MAKITKNKRFPSPIVSFALLALLLVAIVAASQTLLRGKRLDLTENQLYTLSAGSKDVLQGLTEPVNLYFFYSAEQASKLGSVQAWGRRVEELLLEMEQASNGKLNLQIIDPEPFSEQEDLANTLGVEAVPINNLGDTLYLGLAGTNALDGRDVIPFLQPSRESQLEYDIAKMVYELGVLTKPRVGVLSSLPVQGDTDPRTGQSSPPWVVMSQLEQFFEVVPVADTAMQLPDDLGLLVMIHPTNLADSLLYEIDQFVLGGGKALAFIDPYSEVAIAMGGAGMLNAEAPTPNSSLAKLLPGWGAKLIDEKITADATYALGIQSDPRQPPEYHVTLLGLTADAANQDDIISRGLQQINIGVAGALQPTGSTEFTPLLQTSESSGLIGDYLVQPNTPQATLQQALAANLDDQRYTIAARLRGPAKTAFPDGRPVIAGQEAEAPENFVTRSLTESTGDINVVVVADSDMLTDRYWVQVQNQFGQQVIQPIANNLDFFLAAVDNLLGSSALIGIRSRGGYARPFERVEALKREADSRYREKEQQLQQKLEEIEQNLGELRSQGDETGALILPEDSQNQLQDYMNQRIEVRQELRAVQRDLDSNIKQLGRWLRFWNIAFVPILLTLLAIGILWARRSAAARANAGRQETT